MTFSSIKRVLIISVPLSVEASQRGCMFTTALQGGKPAIRDPACYSKSIKREINERRAKPMPLY